MESLVNFAVGKLGDLIVKEAQFLGGVGNQVEWVETELKRIQCCLIDADTKRKGDARVENWLNELRDVAYRIEDAIDTFYVEIEDSRQKDSSGFLNKFNKLCCMPMKVPCLHKLGKELGQIRNVLDGISKSRVDYGIKELPQDTKKERSQADELPMRAKAYLDVDETKIVGLDADKDNILNLLLNSAETPRRAVITIVGLGGLGKTTLARMVYESAKANFKYHIMLSVSQQYNLVDLVRQMLNQKEVDLESILLPKLKSFLSGKKYLIILDDVWEVRLWEQLKDALPNDKNGSRVMITSRSIDVAPVDPEIPPYKLNSLNEKDSLTLLLKEVDEKCPNDLLELADALSKKCNGLPLALKVLGGVLSKKYQNYHDWKNVLDTLDWYSEGEDCMNILAMSYEDMPYYLKPCFLHLACFPEDYAIDVPSLIRMWVADRIIPKNGKKTMEETAENCLQQLFERNMVQLSASPYYSERICRVHDLLRDLAIHEAEKINFVTIFLNPEDVNHSHRVVTRRASLQSDSDELIIKQMNPKTRSLVLCCASWGSRIINSLNLTEFRLLRVLEIIGVKNTEIRGLEKLIHLKYLGIQQCDEINLHIESSLEHLKNLETFNLHRTFLTGGFEPIGLWTISTLRHIQTPYIQDWVLPFNAILRNLQTLRSVKVTEESYQHDQFPCLNNLRELRVNPETIDAIVPLLGTMSCLLSLEIFCPWIPKELVYPTALPNYQDLQSLDLSGKWDKSVSLEARLLPRHLAILVLANSFLGQDPMPELGKLQSLKKLKLIDTVLPNGTYICPTGFPVLETLHFEDMSKCDLLNVNVELLRVEKGVMPKLKYLRISKCPSLKVELPLELQHLIPDYGY
ncbi:Disease resistance family protein [Rhynchospora pubera]|uniref:Disease resistance family protein n=1 Tax=Rhynchospora pubera TaxID=906938 RepID=A0AAV8FYE7_9POAL|nr:Disease resistance family protein [Rhynchospora pubera]